MLYYIPEENKMDDQLGSSFLCICALTLLLMGENTMLDSVPSYFAGFLELCSCVVRMCHKLYLVCTSYILAYPGFCQLLIA